MQKAPIHQSHIYRQIKILRTLFGKSHPRNIPVKLFKNLTSGFGEKSFLRISSCPYIAKSPHSPEPYLLTDQNFANIFWKGSLKEYSCEIISKSNQQFRRRRFFKNFFMSLWCEQPPFTRAMFMVGSKFREHFLKRVIQETFLWNYFKIWPAVSETKIFKEFLYVPIVQEAPIHQSHVYGQIKISRTIFEKGHLRNIPVKLFQNLTSSFEEEDFLRISSCPYSARSPHSPQPCFWANQNFADSFWKGSPKEHSCEIISKSDQQFQKRRFLNNCLKNSISLPWQPVFDGIKFCEQILKRTSQGTQHSCQVWSKLAQWFGSRRCLKKLLTTHDRHITTLKAPLEHVVLRWAKKSSGSSEAPIWDL